MESFAHFRHVLSNTPHLPDKNLAYEWYHTMEENHNVFGFINLNLKDGLSQTVSVQKRDDGDVHVDKRQVDDPAEGGSGPSGENSKDNAEVEGDTCDDEEDEECQGSENKPPANIAQDGARISQGGDDHKPDEQLDSEEQNNQLHLVYRTLNCKQKQC